MEITKREIKNFKEREFPEHITFRPIGIIHSSFKSLKGIPIQFHQSEAEGEIIIFPEYQAALKDVDGFSHIYCIYYFDMVKQPVPLQSKPFLDDEKKGVFSTRTPFRPNPIGISVLEVINVENNVITVKNIDILDSTPVLDIKPFLTEFDGIKSVKSGWLEGRVRKKTS